MKRPFLPSLMIGIAALTVAGCDRHEEHAQQAPAPAAAPVIVNNQAPAPIPDPVPAPAPAPVVVVQDAPQPAPLIEVVTESPGPDYAWAPGVWYQDGNRHWAWRKGIWNRGHADVHVNVDVHGHDSHDDHDRH